LSATTRTSSLCRDLGGCIEHVASWMRIAHEPSSTQRRKSHGSFHHVGATSFRQINWLCSGDTSRLSTRPQHHDHITPLLADLHWLRIPQRIQYKLCVLVYQCVQGSAPSYLQNAICPVASAESRRRLRSASSADLIVPATRRTTMGDRPFAVTAPGAWNSLPDAIRRNLSLAIFKCSLKTYFYTQCFY